MEKLHALKKTFTPRKVSETRRETEQTDAKDEEREREE
jgi:hypothetical protein